MSFATRGPCTYTISCTNTYAIFQITFIVYCSHELCDIFSWLSRKPKGEKPITFAQKRRFQPNSCHKHHLLSLFSPSTDPERGGDDGSERPRGGVHLRRREIRIDWSPQLCHALESEQLPLPRAEAHRVRGISGVSEARVGNSSQFPKSLHIACERSVLLNIYLQTKFSGISFSFSCFPCGLLYVFPCQR